MGKDKEIDKNSLYWKILDQKLNNETSNIVYKVGVYLTKEKSPKILFTRNVKFNLSSSEKEQNLIELGYEKIINKNDKNLKDGKEF